MISVNLLPVEERIPESRLGGAPRWSVLLPVILICAILIPLGGLLLMQRTKISSLREDIARTEVQKARLEPEVRAVERLVQRQRELRERLTALRNLGRNRTEMVQVVDELGRQIPANLWLTRFTTGAAGGYRLEGTSFSNLLVADLMGKLEASDLFYQVDLVETRRSLIGAEPVLDFAITFRNGRQPELTAEAGGS
ncbi:MAG: hypothetical protein GF355_00245 [Candidatus Eisenbacteria bacterium]|nr:hypothetical protein [Candidatus Eisenbacteria bacterium]